MKSVIEIVSSPNGNSPDKQHLQRTNCGTTWYRTLYYNNDKLITQSDWKKVDYFSRHKAVRKIEELLDGLE